MKYIFIFLLVAVSIFSFSQSSRKLHFRSVLVDTHNDVLSSSVLDGLDISQRLSTGHSDLVRWKEGGLDVQFFSVWTGERARNAEGFYKDASEEIDSLDRIIERNPGKIIKAFTYKDVKKGIRKKKLVALVGVEGGHMIENDLEKFEALYKRGMRYMTLTWNNSTSWASSALDETAPSKSPPTGETFGDSLIRKGLTEFGKNMVKKMNELGVIVDLSHVGEQTFYDAINVTTKPVIFSHSSVWNICPVFRNVKDEQIKAVAKNGGVICINFYSGFISKKYSEASENIDAAERQILRDSLMKIYNDSVVVRTKAREIIRSRLEQVRPTLNEMIDHIDYIVKLVGDDHAGIGSDFDGVSSLPVGMEDVTKYSLISEELKRRGYSNKSVKKILGENVLRVMKENFK
jgi:membrane dipeptidase